MYLSIPQLELLLLLFLGLVYILELGYISADCRRSRVKHLARWFYTQWRAQVAANGALATGRDGSE
jgi:hypothetical protein